MLSIHRTQFTPSTWAQLKTFSDRLVYQTPEWISFVAETQEATPVLGEIRDGTSVLGYLTGLTFRRLGVPLFGSPFTGWTTMFMAFNLQPDVPRWLALQVVPRFVYSELGCVYFELVDRHLTDEDVRRAGCQFRWLRSQETDLSVSEQELFQAMDSPCRRCIRKAQKSGVRVVEASPTDSAFASEYYVQLREVFGKQGLAPTYNQQRVESLIQHLGPTGNLLLLRALNPEGHCIATGIYPGMNSLAQFWGNASHRAWLQLRPNEALHWYALRWWKAHGAKVFDWGGWAAYKDKYGCRTVQYPRVFGARFPGLILLRDLAERTFWRIKAIQGRLRSPATAGDDLPTA